MAEQRSMVDAFIDLQKKRQSEQRRLFRRAPKTGADVMERVVRMRGYGRQQSSKQLQDAWQQAIRDVIFEETVTLASGVAHIRHAVLEVYVANATVHQELLFHKTALLTRLGQLAPHQAINNLRFRVGWVEKPGKEETQDV